MVYFSIAATFCNHYKTPLFMASKKKRKTTIEQLGKYTNFCLTLLNIYEKVKGYLPDLSEYLERINEYLEWLK